MPLILSGRLGGLGACPLFPCASRGKTALSRFSRFLRSVSCDREPLQPGSEAGALTSWGVCSSNFSGCRSPARSRTHECAALTGTPRHCRLFGLNLRGEHHLRAWPQFGPSKTTAPSRSKRSASTGRITDANEASLRKSGYSREDDVNGVMREVDMTPPEWIPGLWTRSNDSSRWAASPLNPLEIQDSDLINGAIENSC
jgi:hypothetical protein